MGEAAAAGCARASDAECAAAKNEGPRKRASPESPSVVPDRRGEAWSSNDCKILDSSSSVRHCGTMELWKNRLASAAARCAYATHRPRYALPRKSEDAQTAHSLIDPDRKLAALLLRVPDLLAITLAGLSQNRHGAGPRMDQPIRGRQESSTACGHRMKLQLTLWRDRQAVCQIVLSVHAQISSGPCSKVVVVVTVIIVVMLLATPPAPSLRPGDAVVRLVDDQAA